MKKVFYMALAVATISFASCGNKSSEAANDAEQTEITDSTQTADADAVISEIEEGLNSNNPATVAAATKAIQTKIQELAANGDEEAVKAYVSKIKEFVDKNSDKIKEIAKGENTIGDLINMAKTTDPKTIIQEAGAAINADANKVAGDAKEAADAKVSGAKEAIKSEVNNQVNDAKQKVNDAVNQKVEETKQKANEKVNDALNKGLNKLGI